MSLIIRNAGCYANEQPDELKTNGGNVPSHKTEGADIQAQMLACYYIRYDRQ